VSIWWLMTKNVKNATNNNIIDQPLVVSIDLEECYEG
jgi:hypothetical protein